MECPEVIGFYFPAKKFFPVLFFRMRLGGVWDEVVSHGEKVSFSLSVRPGAVEGGGEQG